jgi:hypothetical protein
MSPLLAAILTVVIASALLGKDLAVKAENTFWTLVMYVIILGVVTGSVLLVRAVYVAQI